MTLYVCDYAWARPDPQAIKAAGFVAVCRYLSHDKTGKTLTKAEVDALHAAGLGVILNFEDSAGRATRGFAAGYADALFANSLADQLGAPSNVPIYYSVDTDPGPTVAAPIREYVRGVRSVPGTRPVGFYGGAVLVNYALGQGAQYGWTANASSWDHGVAPVGQMHQLYSHPAGTPTIAGVDGAQYDTSVVLKTPLGAWGDSIQGALLALTDQQQLDLYNGVIELEHNLMQGIGHSLVNDLINAVAALPKPPSATQIATAVVAKLPAGQTVDVDKLAKAIVKAEGAALTAASQ